MNLTIKDVLSPRIVKYCLPQYYDEYYKSAAREAMVQVELALKEKGMVNDGRYGVNLIRSSLELAGKHKTIKLRIPLGDELQKYASGYFEGVFSYYRNYLAHDGSSVNELMCMRVMILASELLEMIDSSSLSFSDLGGVDGILKTGLFENENQILKLLTLIVDNYFPDGDIEGFLEKYDFDLNHVNAAADLDLIRFYEKDYFPDKEELNSVWQSFSPPEKIGWFEITELGNKFILEIKKDK